MLDRYSGERQIRESPAHAIDESTALPCEYAKYKNPSGFFAVTHDVLIEKPGFKERAVAEHDDASHAATTAASPPRKPLTPAAQRALAEAEARRQAAAADAQPRPKEYQGPKGPEPTRYGDWENKGIASDF